MAPLPNTNCPDEGGLPACRVAGEPTRGGNRDVVECRGIVAHENLGAFPAGRNPKRYPPRSVGELK